MPIWTGLGGAGSLLKHNKWAGNVENIVIFGLFSALNQLDMLISVPFSRLTGLQYSQTVAFFTLT